MVQLAAVAVVINWPKAMPPVPLTLGAYKARSIIANAQRCANLFPESNPPDSPFPFTFYPRPGLTSIAQAPNMGRTRGLYKTSKGGLFGAFGNRLYAIDSGWRFKELGSIRDGLGPVYMGDNGQFLVVGTGQPKTGYKVKLDTLDFSDDVGENWLGATGIGYLDTFMVYSKPNSNSFYTSLSNTLTMDPLYIAGKVGAPDPLQTLITVHREIWLLGTLTSEVWFNNGAAAFPFAAISGVFVEHGCIAPASVVKHGLVIFWLSQDKDGKAIVVLGAEYQAKRISTYAMEDEISDYRRIDDAVGMITQIKGHVFYVLTFPTADKTWVFDMMEGLWHEWVWIDGDGKEHRHRAGAMAFAHGRHICADWENGTIYEMSTGVFDDDRTPIVYRRGFPHMFNSSSRVLYPRFIAEMEAGNTPGGLQYRDKYDFNNDFGNDFDVYDPAKDIYYEADPKVWLRWSDDRGRSWSNPVGQSLGKTGKYATSIQWTRLGMARDRVFELFWSNPTKTALNGASVEAVPLGT